MSPQSHRGDKKNYLREQTDDAAARICHYQSHRHQAGREEVDKFLFLLNRAGENQPERQSEGQLHVAGEVVAIDEWSKGLALRQLAKPVNLVGTGERLRQAEDGEEKSKDGDRPYQQSQTPWRVGKNQDGSEINQQRRHLDQNKPRRVRIKRQAADQGNGVGSHVFRTPQRQQLDHAQQKHSHQRQLQYISADAKRSEAPTVNQPQNHD